MTRIARKRMHHRVRDTYRKARTSARTKDLDQIVEDLKKKEDGKDTKVELDPDLPGQGQFYCTECARHFIDETSLTKHTQSKVHKRRLKELEQGAFTLKEAEEAVGLKTDNRKR